MCKFADHCPTLQSHIMKWHHHIQPSVHSTYFRLPHSSPHIQKGQTDLIFSCIFQSIQFFSIPATTNQTQITIISHWIKVKPLTGLRVFNLVPLQSTLNIIARARFLKFKSHHIILLLKPFNGFHYLQNKIQTSSL